MRGRAKRMDALADGLGPVLVEDCDAVLRGYHVERLIAAGLPVPPWAWTNLLAHGTTRDLLGAVVGATGHPSAGYTDFHRARARLAAEIMDAVGDDRTLSRLQTTTLIPLELALADAPSCRCWSAEQWAATVRAVVAERGRSVPPEG